MEAGYPRSNLFSASSIATQKSNPGHRTGPGFKTGVSRRGPPSVAESMASQDSLSHDTKMLFKSMMGASKLSNFQQRMLDQLVNTGSSLPPVPTPGLAPRPLSAASSSTSSPPTLSQADLSAHHRLLKKRAMMAELTNPRSTLRPLRTILESDAFEQEVYRPAPKKDGTVEKKKLQRYMESDGGKEVLDMDDEEGARIGYGRRKGGLLGRHGGAVAKAAEGNGYGEEPEEIDEFDMVFKEIEERKKWLDDMVSLGRGEVYRKQIQGEIAQRVKRLEQIDKERSQH